MKPELMVTLWPSFPHFPRFAVDRRLTGIRLNSAMMSHPELDQELARVAAFGPSVPLWFDVKARQPRVAEVIPDRERLIVRLNHPIRVRTPQVVLFKAAADRALLERLEDGGRTLVFAPGAEHGPANQVKPGESLHIRHPSFAILGDLFTPEEVGKIEKVKAAGFTKWFLSYVEERSDVDRLQELVGADAEIMLKIETEKGLRYAASEFDKKENLTLVAARGDLYVELERPHLITNALRAIVGKDPEALVGSRILLSTVTDPVPSCADFCELAWLKDIGYKRMMLCDELCLKEELLARAVNAYQAFAMDDEGMPAATTEIDPRFADGAAPPPPSRKRGVLSRLLGRRT